MRAQKPMELAAPSGLALDPCELTSEPGAGREHAATLDALTPAMPVTIGVCDPLSRLRRPTGATAQLECGARDRICGDAERPQDLCVASVIVEATKGEPRIQRPDERGFVGPQVLAGEVDHDDAIEREAFRVSRDPAPNVDALSDVDDLVFRDQQVDADQRSRLRNLAPDARNRFERRRHDALALRARGGVPQNVGRSIPNAATALSRFVYVGDVAPLSHWYTASGWTFSCAASSGTVRSRLSRQRRILSLSFTPLTKHVLAEESSAVERRT